MKVLLLWFVIAATSLVATARFERGTPPPYINHPIMPPQDRHRFRREANPDPQNRGSFSATVNKPMSGPERRPSYNFDYQHNIWQGRNGQISAGGGLQKFPGQKWQPHIGVQGIWRFRREANPQGHGSISATVNKPMSGPKTRPTYNIDYQHNIWSGKNGQISAGGGVQKLPGQRWEPTVGVQGSWRFKREANPQGHGSVSATVNKPMSGSERRPTYNIDYQHNIWSGKNGQISAGGGAQKLPGHRWEPTIGLQGSWRFKREANPQGHGHISITQTKPLEGPERRPSYKIDYQHNIWQGRNGQVTAGGGAQKLPGQRWDPQVGVQGIWHF